MTSSSDALIRLHGVDVKIDATTILEDVTWQLAPGTHWGIVGANGSGKSTFLALLAGTRWPAPGRGTRTYDFGAGPERDAVEARRRITLLGHELQDRYSRFSWNFTATDVVLSGRFRTDVPRREPGRGQIAQARALLDDVGLSALAGRPFLELSRGEQRGVLIARSLAFEPRVLLLDEPAAGLDAAARRRLDTLLERAAERTQLVVAAHAVDDLPAVVTHVAGIDGGRLRSRPAPAAARSRGVEPRAPAVAAPAAGRASSRGGDPLIDVHGADVWLGDRHVLRGIDWRLHDGEHWLVTGANGAGKSTLLRLLHGQHRPAAGGRVRYPGLGDPADVWTLRRHVAWVSPELQAAFRYRSTVHACVGSGFDSSLGLRRTLTDGERERVDELLRRFELTGFAGRLLTELSYGQLRRVLIARALVHRPRVLLLDEPSEGLDRQAAALLARQLTACAAEGTLLVCASHRDDAYALYTHELVLEDGRVAGAHALPAARPPAAADREG